MLSSPIIAIRFVNTKKELKIAHRIRNDVFVKEQGVPPSIEIDEYEADATHMVAMCDERIVGTARWRKTDEGIKLERFAVIKKFRGKGIGKKLVQFALQHLHLEKKIYLHSQGSVIPFYENYGFICVGEAFYEAGIHHQKMVYHKMKK